MLSATSDLLKNLSGHGCFQLCYNLSTKKLKRIVNDNIEYVLNAKRKVVHGSQGTVIFYIHEKSQCELAVKFVDEKNVERAHDEIQSNLLFVNPPSNYIIQVEYAEYAYGKFVLISKAKTCDLWSQCGKKHFTFSEILHLLKCMTKALQYLKNQKLVHNDIKVENIVFDHVSGMYALIDFEGLEKQPSDVSYHRYRTVGTRGTKSFQRLSNIRGQISDDMWSLSIVLFECILDEASLWNSSRDFKPRNQRIAMKYLRVQTIKWLWTPKQINFIINLFRKMNAYKTHDRMTVDELDQCISTFGVELFFDLKSLFNSKFQLTYKIQIYIFSNGINKQQNKQWIEKKLENTIFSVTD